MAETFEPPGDCPVCGEFVPAGAKSCRECGSCPLTGWSEESGIYDHLDLPDPDEEESSDKARPGPLSQPSLWRWVALAVLLGGALLVARDWLQGWRWLSGK